MDDGIKRYSVRDRVFDLFGFYCARAYVVVAGKCFPSHSNPRISVYRPQIHWQEKERGAGIFSDGTCALQQHTHIARV